MIDNSLIDLELLLEKGFNKVRWVYPGFGCDICSELDDKEFNLEDFIKDLRHEAPIYEHSHVNCGCYLEVMNDEGDLIEVDYTGIR